MVTNQQKAEFAHDLELGLARKSVPEFDQLPIIGMAGKLAINIRGLGEIEGAVLRQVADYFFDIPSNLLNPVLEVLEEIGYVLLIKEGRTVRKIIPSVPHFSSVYNGLGEYIGTISLTEHEEVAIAVLEELRSKPEKRDALMGRLGAETTVFRRIEGITSEGGLVLPKRARGHDILVSPFYFADNLDSLAQKAAKGGAKTIGKVLALVKSSQGWPLSMIVERQEINGSVLSMDEINLLTEMVADGVLRPPSLAVARSTKIEHFIFTPSPGNKRLDGAAREIYERAMALVAAVRKGQLLPEKYRIRSPVALLSKLRSEKWIGASTEAAAQYSNLVALRVGKLVPRATGWYRFELIDTEENVRAVDIAVQMFETGEPSLGVQDDARLALQRDESYIQSLVSATKLRVTERPALGPDDQRQYEQFLLDL